METTTPKRLGELLVNKHLLNAWQLDLALQEQRETKEFLGALLVRKGWITEEALLKTLGEQFGMPVVHLEQEPIDWAASQQFPAMLQTNHPCFPLRMDARSVTVAIANPLDAWAISEVEKAAALRKVHVVLAPAGEIRSAVQRAQRRALKGLSHPRGAE